MLEVNNLTKEYPMPGKRLVVLSDIDFTLNSAESASIVGPSGSGKSTFLYILGALELPSSGSVRLAGRNPFQMNEKELAAFRNREIGFVFQDHHLLPQCSVLENVLIPTLVSSTDNSFQERARNLLEQVGLTDRIHHRPHELSGGEKQRVALARAIILKPQLVLCDEPTGNLDHESAETVISMLFNLHKNQENMLVVVTHTLEIAERFGLKFKLSSSRLQPV